MAGAIKAIIFDLGGVLIRVNKQPFYQELAKHSPLPLEKIANHFSSKVLTGFDRGFGKGLITPRQFFEHAVKEMKLKDIAFEDFVKSYNDVFTRKEEVIGLLRQLKDKHVIGLLSNTDALHHKGWLKALGNDFKLFDHVVLSFEVKATKPDIQIYAAMLAKLGLKAGECVFIDDIPEYADGASKLGIHGICFVSVEQLKADLKKLGVTA